MTKTMKPKELFVTATGVRLGSKGRVATTPDGVLNLLLRVSKGAARKIRKSLFAKGWKRLAAVNAHNTPMTDAAAAAA